MKPYLIGIDPGASGAWVVMTPGTFELIEWGVMPTLKVGTATRVNAAALAASLRPFADGAAHLEAVGAMPGQGVTSMFAFGHAAGTAWGVLGGLGIECTFVAPVTWKKRAGLAGTEKDAARSRGIQLWPKWRDLDAKAKGQALADAALIARFGGEA